MFKDGPVWRPPIANFYTQGMPDELVVDPDAPVVHKGALSNAYVENRYFSRNIHHQLLLMFSTGNEIVLRI